MIILFTVITANPIIAQNNYNLKQFGDETLDLLKQPSKWNAGDWLIFGGIVGGTYAIMHFDENVRSLMMKDRSYVNSIPMRFGTLYGAPYTPLLLGGAILIHGISKDNIPNKRLGFEILQASIYSVIITGFFKYAFGRDRPYTGSGAFTFNPFSFGSDDHLSLNSGHTAIAFSISTVLAANSGTTFLKVLSFVPAFITGYSRMYHNKHWASDVFAGAAIGYFVARFVVNTHDEKEKQALSPIQNTPLVNIVIPF